MWRGGGGGDTGVLCGCSLRAGPRCTSGLSSLGMEETWDWWDAGLCVSRDLEGAVQGWGQWERITHTTKKK